MWRKRHDGTSTYKRPVYIFAFGEYKTGKLNFLCATPGPKIAQGNVECR